MAEAMCGPSNPLQQFKQQTSLDRSLQQDRFSSRHHPAQSFRSANPNAGLLDPEFEAFQAGRSTTPVLDPLSHFQPSPHFSGPSQAPSWADDFQRISLFPQPQMQQQPLHFAAGPSSSSWAQGFRDQFKSSAPRASSPSPLAFQQMARYGGNGFQSSFAQPSFAPEMQSARGKAPVTDTFDEAAFEKAFDMAREDLMTDVDVETQGFTAESVLEAVDTTMADPAPLQEEQIENNYEKLMQDLDLDLQMEQLPLATQEPIHDEAQPEELQNDDDALAATAQELLAKVEHNQSDKFKNSQFLSLMRKLADRQVHVEGDKMVETADATSTSYAGATLNAPSNDTAMHSATSGQHEVQHGPLREQDYHQRTIDPKDGNDVVNLLNDPALAEEIGPYRMPRIATDDVGTYAPNAQSQNAAMSEMLYGANGILSTDYRRRARTSRLSHSEI